MSNPVKVIWQTGVMYIHHDKTGAVVRRHTIYGSWRIWCTICGMYEWSPDPLSQAAALDAARAHCASGAQR